MSDGERKDTPDSDTDPDRHRLSVDAELSGLFESHRERLHRMIEIRLDRRIRGRLDASDVLQEVYLEAARSYPTYRRNPEAPFYLWLRCIAGRTLTSLLRYHLGAQIRDARKEISLHEAMPQVHSDSLAVRLLGHDTSPSEEAERAELRRRVSRALDRMDRIDREVLVLRHFEQLSNVETAHVLSIEEAAASKRHVRALKRLRRVLQDAPGSPLEAPNGEH